MSTSGLKVSTYNPPKVFIQPQECVYIHMSTKQNFDNKMIINTEEKILYRFRKYI